MTLPAYTGTLAPAHRQLIAGIGDQWAAAVLSTDPVDSAAAVEAVRRLYDTHKLRRPPLTIWMDSPAAASMPPRSSASSRRRSENSS
jgi:hypothetical protein